MNENFWNALAVYCRHIAPLVGPVVVAIGRAAEAMDEASMEVRALPSADTPEPD